MLKSSHTPFIQPGIITGRMKKKEKKNKPKSLKNRSSCFKNPDIQANGAKCALLR